MTGTLTVRAVIEIGLLLTIAVALLALLWVKLRPPTKAVMVAGDDLLATLLEVRSLLSDAPASFKMFGEVVNQFRASSESMRDIVQRLDDATEANKVAAALLEHNSTTAAQERALTVSLLTKLTVKADGTLASADRLEAAAAVVASELQASQRRADETEGPDGAAADAASRSTQ